MSKAEDEAREAFPTDVAICVGDAWVWTKDKKAAAKREGFIAGYKAALARGWEAAADVAFNQAAREKVPELLDRVAAAEAEVERADEIIRKQAAIIRKGERYIERLESVDVPELQERAEKAEIRAKQADDLDTRNQRLTGDWKAALERAEKAETEVERLKEERDDWRRRSLGAAKEYGTRLVEEVAAVHGPLLAENAALRETVERVLRATEDEQISRQYYGAPIEAGFINYLINPETYGDATDGRYARWAAALDEGGDDA